MPGCYTMTVYECVTNYTTIATQSVREATSINFNTEL